MRLVDTTSLELRIGEHTTFQKEGYAVLSHRWAPQEITLDQLGSHVQELRSGGRGLRPQLAKVRGACEIARSKGIKWIWIDSCCIDKRDLVETTESINSMYKWYHNSTLCIVYLYDVKMNDAIATTDPHIFDRLGQEKPSEWFSRGWTLAELLAPLQMEFYDKEWTYIGTKKEMKTAIGSITGIDEKYLTGEDDFRKACIAQKMSWMAGRTTTNKEDIAYSMIGLFEITMSPVYGEGMRAFKRLQHTLMSSMPKDESLFAWKMPALNAGDRYNRFGGDRYDRFSGDWTADEWGLLAPSPEWFAGCAGIRTLDGIPPRQGSFRMEPNGVTGPVGRSAWTGKVFLLFSVATIGLVLGILPGIIPFLYTRNLAKRVANEDYTFMLHCIEVDGSGRHKRVGIHLRPIIRRTGGYYFDMFADIVLFKRVRCTEFGRISGSVRNVPGFVRQPTLLDF